MEFLALRNSIYKHEKRKADCELMMNDDEGHGTSLE